MSSVRRLGPGTVAMEGAYLLGASTVVGPMEGDGPLGAFFDRVWDAERTAAQSFEKAELALLTESHQILLDKTGQAWEDVDVVLGGDLLDQLITTDFAARAHGRPLLGVFAACATFTQAVGLGSMLVASGSIQSAMASAVSHHLAAERQFRFPVELGYQRPPTSSWTATAAGSVLVGTRPSPIMVEAVTFGRVVDWGAKDPNDMATAMTPAAVDTLIRHLQTTHTSPQDYSHIFTGDLGQLGHQLAIRLAKDSGSVDLSGDRFEDCGRLIYDPARQDVHNGASGAGCSAAVFGGYIVHQLEMGAFNRVLLVATGALFSPATYQQGESIPCIAHAVTLARTPKEEVSEP